MFGYVVTNPETLSAERQQRFRAMYCGLCRTLRLRHGISGATTLSYDMTFLAMLLNAVYEPEEKTDRERCFARPGRHHAYVISELFDYVADMNLALAFHKCLDNWIDDRNLICAAESRLLRKAYHRISKNWPLKCQAIEDWIKEIHQYERERTMQIDFPVNATGKLMGELFVYPGRMEWVNELRTIGDALGRFIYFMDAYEDLSADIKSKRYNALIALRDCSDYEDICLSSMKMMLADAVQAFETLPVILDYDILSNVLYTGIWSKYALLQKKRKPDKGAK